VQRVPVVLVRPARTRPARIGVGDDERQQRVRREHEERAEELRS
jgi:hypothetical protein